MRSRLVTLTPEYNHSVPAVLKNAIDSVFATFAFRNKPAAWVAYSGGIGGGIRAIEHLAQPRLATGEQALQEAHPTLSAVGRAMFRVLGIRQFLLLQHAAS